MPPSTLLMWDASNLPPSQPGTPVAAFYIGGDTPHVYTDEQIREIRARYALPIWTCYDHNHDEAIEAAKAIAWLHGHHWAPGTLVALDTEELVIPGFIDGFNQELRDAGWHVLHYESKSSEGGNPPTDGGRWSADWTGQPHLLEGDTATQYLPDRMSRLPYDLSLIKADARLHELNPPVRHVINWVDVTMRLPILGQGDAGPAVARMQHLLEAWHPGSTGPAGADGIFGPATLDAVISFQRIHGFTSGYGTCGARTWVLLTAG